VKTEINGGQKLNSKTMISFLKKKKEKKAFS